MRHAPWFLLVALLAIASRGNAGNSVEDAGFAPLPLGAEHRALQRQVELMRAEAARPRGWQDRERGEKVKAELAGLEQLLAEVETLHADRLARCQRKWLVRAKVRDPRVGAHPAYYACPETAMVPDEVVRAIRRRDEIRKKALQKGLPSQTRTELEGELRKLDVVVDRAVELEALHVEDMERLQGVDAGSADVPEGR